MDEERQFTDKDLRKLRAYRKGALVCIALYFAALVVYITVPEEEKSLAAAFFAASALITVISMYFVSSILVSPGKA